MNTDAIYELDDAEILNVALNKDSSKDALYITLAGLFRHLQNGEYNLDYSWTFEDVDPAVFVGCLLDIEEECGMDPIGLTIMGVQWSTDDNRTYLWGSYLKESEQYIRDADLMDGEIPQLTELKLL